jgi:hypothetical protein
MGISEIELLKGRRKLWVEALNSQDKHSIFNQFSLLAFNINSYRIINEAKRLAPVDEKGKVKLNGMLYNLLDNSFIESTLLKIRRLTESYTLNSESMDKNKDVYSIVSIINDMKDHSNLLIRKNLFEVENLEYDIELLRKKQSEYERNQLSMGNFGFFSPSEIDPSITIERHSDIDFLCNVRSDKRSEHDQISQKIFNALAKKITEKVVDINNYVNKRIAHAATPESEVNKSVRAFSIHEIVDTVIGLMKISNFIQHYILNEGTNMYRISLASDEILFKYIDQPLAKIENTSDLQNKWNECQSDFSKGDKIFVKQSNSITDFIDKNL